MYITEVIVMDKYTTEEIATMFGIGEGEVVEIQKCNDRMVNDTNVSAEEYEEWCEKTDKMCGELK